jgi:hypothetical protein
MWIKHFEENFKIKQTHDLKQTCLEQLIIDESIRIVGDFYWWSPNLRNSSSKIRL